MASKRSSEMTKKSLLSHGKLSIKSGVSKSTRDGGVMAAALSVRHARSSTNSNN